MSDKNKNISIGFTGDIAFTGVFQDKVKNKQNIFDKDLAKLLLENDANIINFEGAIKDKNPVKNGKVISNPIYSVPFLIQNNMCVFNLANNHIMDFGISGLKNTIKILNNNEIAYFGAGMNIYEASKISYLSKNNITIAFIGICHNEGIIADNNNAGIFSNNHKKLLINKIKEAKKNANWVVLNYHGGAEFTYFPIPHKRTLLHEYISYEADIIVANHPHVVQGYEKLDKKIIFYSLGNFIFANKYFDGRKGVFDSMILNIEFYKDKFRFSPHFINIDCKNGVLKSVKHNVAKNNFKEIKDDYDRKWKEDAYRLIFIDAKEFIKRRILKTKSNKIIKILKYYKWFLKLLKGYYKGGKSTRPILYAAFNCLFKLNKSNY